MQKVFIVDPEKGCVPSVSGDTPQAKTFHLTQPDICHLAPAEIKKKDKLSDLGVLNSL